VELFDPPLGPDPKLALLTPVVDPLVSGPARRAQFVVELVGPHSLSASAAAQLLTPSWQGALGQPEAYCMSPSDTQWQVLSDRKDGSYDSLVLCWDILSAQGQLTTASAKHLFRQAEQLANAIGRRAMPLPVPDDMNRTAKDLLKIQEQLDVGVSVEVIPKSGVVMEKDLWVVCSKLGLQFSPEGSFDWRVPHHPCPLFSVTPIGDTEAFSLGSVQRGARHEGVTVGFNLPRCPAPMAALDGAFQACETIAAAIDGVSVDDSGRLMTAAIADEMRRSLQMGVEALESIGLKPGSASALKLF
jgi:hypothetical protein